jgi:hypothetical protein
MVSMYFNPALESEQDRSDQELIAIRAQREEEIHRVCVAGPLCIQGNKILSDIFSTYQRGYVERNRGCSANDLERDFLTMIIRAFPHIYLDPKDGYKIRDEIEKLK